jgi:D-3-phosphoglycerate dehydrogenase
MLDADVLARCMPGVRIVNVARGPLIDEAALIAALQSGHVHSAALDVFEIEPLPMDSPLRSMERCIFGSHNGSNTVDAVIRASHTAIERLSGFF